MPKQSLLVADADPRSLRILEVALRKAGFSVITAADAAEALRRMQRAPPDLVLCDVGLPGQGGMDLCRELRADERLAGLPVLLMGGERSPATRSAALEAGADDLLAKPLLIKELVARVRMLLTQREQARYAQRGAPAALTGSVGDLGLVDLFTSLENWQKSATVLCDGEGRSARVWVRDGQVIDAEVEPLTGEAAFYRLLNWDAGSFRVEFGAVDREARTDAGTQALLMEGMRRIDELGRMAEALPFSSVLTVDFQVLAAQLAEMPDELNGVLRLFDGRRSLRQAVSESPLDDLSTMGVVQRLLADGVLVHGVAAAPRGKASLGQWLGGAAPPDSGGPAEQPGAEPAPAAAAAIVRLPLVAAGGAGAAGSPAGPPAVVTAKAGGKIALLRFPPLRGMRRERLRREAEEARQAVALGRPVRLTHVIELPPAPGGGDALPEGARRMSAAVGEAAKRFAPDLAIARLTSQERRPLTAADLFAEGPAKDPSTVVTPPSSAAVRGALATDAPTPPTGTPMPPEAGPAGAAVADSRPRSTPAASRPAHLSAPPIRAAAVVERRRKVRLRAYAAAAVALAIGAAAAVLLRQARTKQAPPVESAQSGSTAPAAVSAPPPVPAAAPPEEVAAGPAVPPPSPADEYRRALSSGEALLKRGKYRAAIAEFRKATALQPESVPALLALGDAFLEAELALSAIKPLQQVAALDPKNARAQLLLGTAFHGLGRENEAVKAYQKYLVLEPRGEFAGDVRAIVANLSR